LKLETENLKPRVVARMEEKSKEFVEKGAEDYVKA
jgi:hypothetical protein